MTESCYRMYGESKIKISQVFHFMRLVLSFMRIFSIWETLHLRLLFSMLVSPCSTEDALSDWEKKHICSVESILASRAYVKSHSQPLDIKGH